MQRLVYSPSIKVWVKSDSGIIDLSPYVVSCNVDRKVNDVSTAQVEFRNPKVMQDGKSRFMFTEHSENGQILPVFHPMDPITITFERIAGRPIQVFTGYCDSTPDVQLFPGTAKITASCTLKRLKYTYWDPALPFVNDFMKNYGWQLNQQTGQVGTDPGTTNKDLKTTIKNNSNNLNDSTMGNLVYAVLNEVGGWDPSNIYIQPLPENIVDRVTNLFDEFNKDNKSQIEEVKKLLRDIVGSGSYGTSSAGGNDGASTGGADSQLSGTVTNERSKVITIRNVANQHSIPPEFVLAVAIVETSLDGDTSSADTGDNSGWFQWSGSQSYVGQPVLDMSKRFDLGYSAGQFCKAAKAREKYKQYGYPTWARSCQLNPSSFSNLGTHDDYGAFNPTPKGNALYNDNRFPAFVEDARAKLAKYAN